MLTLASGSPTRSLHLSLVILVALAVTGTPTEGHAQTPEQTPSPTSTPASPAASLVLVDQPISYGPDDRLDLELRIVNDGTQPLTGFQLVIGVDPKVRTRSDLHEEFTPSPGLAASSLPFGFAKTVAPGGSATVVIDEPVNSFPTLAGSSEGGVFPAKIELRTADGVAPLDIVAVPFIFYPQKPETRLDIALVLPLNALPQRGAGGGFEMIEEGDDLIRAVAPGGWLRGFVRSLARAIREPAVVPDNARRGRRRPRQEAPTQPLRLSLAPTPRLLEELTDMADGFPFEDQQIPDSDDAAQDAADIIESLRSLVAQDEVQTVLVPYSFPDLPTLVERMPGDHTNQQVETGRAIVSETLGIDVDGDWFFPPAGRLDQPSLEQLQSLNHGNNIFLSEDVLIPAADISAAGCPELSPSFTCVTEIQTTTGTSNALITDAGISARLSDLLLEPNDRLTLQEFFAETAMIREEAPGLTDRVVQATVPSLWHPSARLTGTLLQGIREAPWLRSITAEEAIAGKATVVSRRIVAEAPRLRTEPDTAFFDGLRQLTDLVESYGSIVPPGNQRIVRLRRNVLAAASRSWWPRPEVAFDYLGRSRKEIEGEMDKIGLAGPTAFTFTARDGELQFVVVNETDYAVRLNLILSSENFTFDSSSYEQTFPPGRQLVDIQATARTSGQFPLEVRLQTPDGYPIAETSIAIRSTSLNRVALGITVGALTFLILFYVLRAVRKRSKQNTEAETTA